MCSFGKKRSVDVQRTRDQLKREGCLRKDSSDLSLNQWALMTVCLIGNRRQLVSLIILILYGKNCLQECFDPVEKECFIKCDRSCNKDCEVAPARTHV